MKTVDLTILAYDAPVTYAYLAGMKAAGFQPEKIIDLRVVPKRALITAFVHFFGIKLAFYIVRTILHHRVRAKINQTLCDQLFKNVFIQPDYFKNIDYKNYTPNVERVYALGLDDPHLIDFFKQQHMSTFLYTAGGIMPKTLLSIPGKRFLHLHPGLVPFVKGSDGFFWSVLTRGQPGMSCFYMNAGIDTGDIIMTKEFDRPDWDIDTKLYDYEVIYNGILQFYDPILRARLLVDVLETFSAHSSLNELPSTSQNPNEGRTYFYMHPRLRNRVIDHLACPH